jgi:hypothetical protein
LTLLKYLYYNIVLRALEVATNDSGVEATPARQKHPHNIRYLGDSSL